MSEDFMEFSSELLGTTREAMEYSKMYMEARKECKQAYNKLQSLIFKANLHTSKKSIDNKITELMASEDYGEEARVLNELMYDKESEYKGLELVVKTYLAHASALQSIIKTQISGEISEATAKKYGSN